MRNRSGASPELPGKQDFDRHSTVKGRSLFRHLMARGAEIFAILGLFLSVGCETPVGHSIPKEWVGQTPGALAPGDVVKLSFPGAPELSQSQKIRADGKISLPLLGEVDAAGKRLGQFEDELAGLYKSQLKNNEVIVALESSGIPIYVSGAVLKPGKVMLDRKMTVLEAIMESGGFVAGSADPRKVVVIRNTNGQQLTQVLDLSPALRGKATTAFYVKAYDAIYVPKTWNSLD